MKATSQIFRSVAIRVSNPAFLPSFLRHLVRVFTRKISIVRQPYQQHKSSRISLRFRRCPQHHHQCRTRSANAPHHRKAWLQMYRLSSGRTPHTAIVLRAASIQASKFCLQELSMDLLPCRLQKTNKKRKRNQRSCRSVVRHQHQVERASLSHRRHLSSCRNRKRRSLTKSTRLELL